MNWKKIGLFVFFLIVGLVIFWYISGFFSFIHILMPFLFLGYIITLILVLIKHSILKIVILVLFLVMHLLIVLIPFPWCDSSGFFVGKSQECSCLGFKKYISGLTDVSGTQCVGIITDYKCYDYNLVQGKTEITCEL